MLLVELCKLPFDRPSDLEEYEIWISSGKILLPHAGGWRDQPAGIMQALKRLDHKFRLVEKLAEIEEKEASQVKNFNNLNSMLNLDDYRQQRQATKEED